MTKDTSGPAFPTSVKNTSGMDLPGFAGDIIGAKTQSDYKGLSIREYAAIKAMAGLLSDGEVMSHLTAYAQQQKKPLQEIVTGAAVNYADALLAELEK